MDTYSLLKPGTLLRGGTYCVEAPIAIGGFGNTYRVRNVMFNETYAMKEFFMRGVNTRRGDSLVMVSVPENMDSFDEQKAKFHKEAQRLRSLHNAHIVKVHDLFEENNTAYYIMDFIDGQSVADRMKALDRPLSEQEVRHILPQILDALKTVHSQNIWHMDIKPANIMVDKSGRAFLIDFGASKQLRRVDGQQSSALCYTPGFAPMEQVAQESEKFGPWTDFYALGASLYYMLTRQVPPSSSQIIEGDSAFKFSPNVSQSMRDLIRWMMMLKRDQRPQQVADIEQRLNGGHTGTQTIVIQPKKQKQRMKTTTILAAVLAALLIALGAYFLLSGGKKGSHTDSYYEDDTETAAPASESRLKKIAEAVNDECPMDMGQFGTVTSIVYDESDNAIVYSYTVNESIIDVEAMATNRMKMKENMLTMLSNPSGDMRTLMEIIIEEDGKLRYIYTGATSGITARATLTADELNDALNTNVTPRQKVQGHIDVTKLQLPMRVDEMTVLTSVELEGSTVVYEYDLEESDDLTVSMLKADRASTKRVLEDLLYNNASGIEKEFVSQVIAAGLNVCYRYNGNLTGDYIDIIFTNDELSRNLK
ncbi:MAG: serine/threonine protein kinase [Prevotella sp.]|nr:serine/threonine protein kinase [Prevotella sp.]